MSVDSVIRKLEMINHDALAIWRSIEKYYGYGFFNRIIEDEFGINPDSHE